MRLYRERNRAHAVGAGIILLSEQTAGECLAGDVTVTIHLPNTATGITPEVLTIDAQAVAAAYTLESAYSVESLRQQLGF